MVISRALAPPPPPPPPQWYDTYKYDSLRPAKLTGFLKHLSSVSWVARKVDDQTEYHNIKQAFGGSLQSESRQKAEQGIVNTKSQ